VILAGYITMKRSMYSWFELFIIEKKNYADLSHCWQIFPRLWMVCTSTPDAEGINCTERRKKGSIHLIHRLIICCACISIYPMHKLRNVIMYSSFDAQLPLHVASHLVVV